MNETKSRDVAYFDQVYRRDPDPWRFASSPYEHEKYAATLAALGESRFLRGLEVGCSIGVLTAQLAERCAEMVGIDIAAAPLRQAEQRCRDKTGLSFFQMAVPDQWPTGQFDLIVLSEVLYFLAPADIERLAHRVMDSLLPSGYVLTVNWLGEADNPCTGHQAADIFAAACGPNFAISMTQMQASYRLDLLRKINGEH